MGLAPRIPRPEIVYQQRVSAALSRLYETVQIQWYPFLGEGRQMYAPIVDIAVGPFATRARYGPEYTALLNRTEPFIHSLILCHNENFADDADHACFARILTFNDNARCLLCIEIEQSGSRKHCLGNLVNASSLGRVGLLVARTEKTLRTFIRQRIYLRFLAEVGKNTFRTDNALVLSEPQFNACLERAVQP
jgi:hypothetical protein